MTSTTLLSSVISSTITSSIINPTETLASSLSLSSTSSHTTTALTVPTLIPNTHPDTRSNTTIISPPFVNNRTTTPSQPSPIYIIIPVVIAVVCLIAMIALCSWIRWKRRNNHVQKGWWAEDQEMGVWTGAGYGAPTDQKYHERGSAMYEPDLGRKLHWVKRPDRWSGGVSVQETEVRGGLDDEESLSMLPAAASRRKVSGGGRSHVSDEGSEEDESADMIVRGRPEARESKTVKHGSGGRAGLGETYQSNFATIKRKEVATPMGVTTSVYS